MDIILLLTAIACSWSFQLLCSYSFSSMHSVGHSIKESAEISSFFSSQWFLRIPKGWNVALCRPSKEKYILYYLSFLLRKLKETPFVCWYVFFCFFCFVLTFSEKELTIQFKCVGQWPRHSFSCYYLATIRLFLNKVLSEKGSVGIQKLLNHRRVRF